MGRLSNFFVSIDQLGNVLAGGNPDNTISSRVGFYTEEYYKDRKIPFKWKVFRNIIDFTFFPIDGENHCKEAYFNDAGEEFDPGTSDLAIAVLTIIIIPSCAFIALVLYFLNGVGLVSKKKIDRTANIKKRIKMANAKLKGVFTELNVHQITVDEELEEIILTTEDRVKEISIKIQGMLDLKDRFEVFKSKKENIDNDL